MTSCAAPRTPSPSLFSLPKGGPAGITDLRNVGSGGLAGHVTAALYLQSFLRPVEPLSGASAGASAEASAEAGATEVAGAGPTAWIHVDAMSFNRSARPGRPVGGEAQGLRALFELLRRKYPRGG